MMENQRRRIREVPAIKEARGATILRRESISKIVEEPLVAASEILYDKNIRTLESSGNAEDIERGEVGIVIQFDSLSPENQEIARQSCNIAETDDWGTVATLAVPISEEMTIEEIQQKTVELAERFNKQPMTWVATKTIDQLKVMFTTPADEEFPIEDFINSPWYKRQGWHYDENEKLFYLSEEHWQKAHEPADQNSK
ncbi:MAG: hypothetical protein HYV32_00650 [Candidatus Kerfeldbacteria bacterium]|nr:hypothetical protein [Candidatus Kerfeldbacteria bacterium]